jgi:CTP synthase
VRELRGVGIQPDMLVCRSTRPLGEDERAKIALFCNTDPEAIIENLDAESLYEIPLLLEQRQMADQVCKRLELLPHPPELAAWEDMVRRIKDPSRDVCIAVIGKYMHLHDSYLSVTEALLHGGIHHEARVNVLYVESDTLGGKTAASRLQDADGLLVPGGFGERGIEGKIRAIQYARENGVPFLGLCLGLQTAVIEFARNVCGLADANSKEFDEATPHPLIIKLKEQEYVTRLGGSMRLGAYPCRIVPGTLAERVYQEPEVPERHRHRYEVNNAYRDRLSEAGMVFGGTSPQGDLVEMIEIPDHPFFIASQFHPEFKSRPNRAHPLFRDLIGAALSRRAERRAAVS